METNIRQSLNGSPIQYLNGFNRTIKRVHSEIEIIELSRKLKLFLMAQREAIQKNTQAIQHVNPVQAVTNINFVLNAWDNLAQRKAAVEQLALKEQQFNHGTLFFRTVLAFLNGSVHFEHVYASGYIALSADLVAKIQNGLGALGSSGYTDNEKRTHGINTTLLASARGAYLLLVRFNFRNWAEKMAPSYFPVNVAGSSTDAPWYRLAKDKTSGTTGNPVLPTTDYKKVYTEKFGLTASEHLHAREVLFNNYLKTWYKMGGDWEAIKRATLKGSHKMLVTFRDLPGYQYWCRYDDYYMSPALGTDPEAITPQWKEIDGLAGENGLGCVDPATGQACVVATIVALATPIIGAVTTFMVLFKNPKGASTLNPDGTPIADPNTNTGLPTTTNQNDNNNTNPFKKYALWILALAGIGAGTYFLIPKKQ